MASLAPLLNQLSEAFPIPVGDDDRSDSGTLDALRLCLKQILSLILDLTLNEKEPDSPLNVVKKTVSKAQKRFQEALLQRIKNGKRYAVKIYLTSLHTSTNLSLCSGAFDKLLMSLPDSKSWAVLARYWCYEDFRVAVLRSVTEEIVQPSTSSSNYSSDILLLIKQNANDPDPEPLGPWVGSGGLAAGHRINKLLLVSAHGADLSQEAFSPALCWLVLAATCLCPHTPLMADRNAGARVRGS